jgi:membrane-associated phospholipid phosphatase
MKKMICMIAVVIFSLTTTSLFAQKTYAGVTYLHKLQDKRTDSKTSFNKFLSGTATPVSLGTPLTLWVVGMIDNNKTIKKQALFTLESFAVSQALTFATKSIVNKPRPHEYDPTLIALRNAKNGSFPSGHTAEAFATATSLTLMSHKWYVAVPAYTWATLVGQSRLYLGVHYPADVIGGAITGAGSAWLSYKLNKWMHHTKKNKVSIEEHHG